MLPITRAHIEFPAGPVIHLAHFRHARLGFLGGDEAFAEITVTEITVNYGITAIVYLTPNYGSPTHAQAAWMNPASWPYF